MGMFTRGADQQVKKYLINYVLLSIILLLSGIAHAVEVPKVVYPNGSSKGVPLTLYHLAYIAFAADQMTSYKGEKFQLDRALVRDQAKIVVISEIMESLQLDPINRQVLGRFIGKYQMVFSYLPMNHLVFEEIETIFSQILSEDRDFMAYANGSLSLKNWIEKLAQSINESRVSRGIIDPVLALKAAEVELRYKNNYAVTLLFRGTNGYQDKIDSLLGRNLGLSYTCELYHAFFTATENAAFDYIAKSRFGYVLPFEKKYNEDITFIFPNFEQEWSKIGTLYGGGGIDHPLIIHDGGYGADIQDQMKSEKVFQKMLKSAIMLK